MPESASTSLSKNKGEWAEQRALEYFQQRDYQVHARNHEVAGVEIDLILKREAWTLVEVKALQIDENISFRLSFSQQKRLLYARQAWQSRYQQAVALRVAFVSPGQILDLGIEDLF